MLRHIKSLQVFEAVAKSRHVTQAAHTLGISQSSVSYHIRKLEDELSVQLFDRSKGGFELTANGAVLADHVQKGLAEFERGVSKLCDTRTPSEIRVSVVPMFASRFLASRLGHFWETYPGIQISFAGVSGLGQTITDLSTGLDLAVRWGRGSFEGCEAIEIFRDDLVVVCSPDFLRRYPIESEEDIDRCPLLHVDDHSMWAEWFSRIRGGDIRGESQMMLEDRSFQLGSTRNGLGLSLFVESFVRNDLALGTLINPLGRSYPTTFAYYLLMDRTRFISNAAKTFGDWLLEQCKTARLPR